MPRGRAPWADTANTLKPGPPVTRPSPSSSTTDSAPRSQASYRPLAKSSQWPFPMRGSRDPGAVRPRVHDPSTQALRSPARRTHPCTPCASSRGRRRDPAAARPGRPRSGRGGRRGGRSAPDRRARRRRRRRRAGSPGRRSRSSRPRGRRTGRRHGRHPASARCDAGHGTRRRRWPVVAPAQWLSWRMTRRGAARTMTAIGKTAGRAPVATPAAPPRHPGPAGAAAPPAKPCPNATARHPRTPQ